MNTLFSETIKLKNGVLCNLKYHQERVDRTLHQFYGTTIDLSVLNGMVPEDKTTGLYKCRMVFDSRIETVGFTPYASRKMKEVAVVEDNEIEYAWKYTDRRNLDALLEKSGCDDIIIVKNKLVTDSFSANLVFQSASGLYTPEDCLLRGTKRQYLIECGVIRPKTIHVEEIEEYNRIFFINAMIDLEDNICIEISSLRR